MIFSSVYTFLSYLSLSTVGFSKPFNTELMFADGLRSFIQSGRFRFSHS